MSERRLMRDVQRDIKELYRCDCGCGRKGVIWWRELLWAPVCWETRYADSFAA